MAAGEHQEAEEHQGVEALPLAVTEAVPVGFVAGQAEEVSTHHEEEAEGGASGFTKSGGFS